MATVGAKSTLFDDSCKVGEDNIVNKMCHRNNIYGNNNEIII